MSTSSDRMTGVVLVRHPIGDYGQEYGVIRGEDGKHYVFSNRNVFRNTSHASVGTTVTFRVAEWSYATDISDVK